MLVYPLDTRCTGLWTLGEVDHPPWWSVGGWAENADLSQRRGWKLKKNPASDANGETRDQGVSRSVDS